MLGQSRGHAMTLWVLGNGRLYHHDARVSVCSMQLGKQEKKGASCAYA